MDVIYRGDADEYADKSEEQDYGDLSGPEQNGEAVNQDRKSVV